jgi:hypothetical protein
MRSIVRKWKLFPSLQRTKCTSTEIFHLPPGLKGKLKDTGALKRLLMLQVHKSNGLLFNAHMPSGDKNRDAVNELFLL